MKIKIEPFGYMAEIISEKTIELEEGNLYALKNKLEYLYPEIRNKPYKIALNRVMVNNNMEINETTEVAILPPFAGG